MNTPIILIEVVLVFGGVLLFGWWQLRSIKRDQKKAAEERQRQRVDAERAGERSEESAEERGQKRG